jgi:hypothetical protein
LAIKLSPQITVKGAEGSLHVNLYIFVNKHIYKSVYVVNKNISA